ncbi:hypothetical protein AT15_07210 [Kosmotoga arenicorallina S304]|uniref:N-acetyltransferase domain-containing protein n=1 Tax=Kosmotoga arenicorallina S304 TaxID=1453497 RepID=A0A182C7L1_9BACT|nr:GNAT family N-acetyltransferase [Kosmotoga arenicorallina]OAA31277.1 hypothetical protein AT15_07210 [Kosmotoga arenicorallina S304]
MLFRKVETGDFKKVVELTSGIWDGEDYIPSVFEKWINERNGYFYCLDGEQGQLIALGRLKLFDEETGWLEGLRVAQHFQGKGFGKEMARKMIQLAKSLGIKKLLFSTYFDNVESITINEKIGFYRIDTYTNLQLDALSSEGSIGEVSFASFHIEGFISNDWVFFQAKSKITSDLLPAAEFVDISGCRMLFAQNIKFPETLEISWVDSSKVTDKAIACAISFARSRGYKKMHLMLKAGAPLEPFLKNGFYYFERSEDVYLYSGEVEKLKLT